MKILLSFFLIIPSIAIAQLPIIASQSYMGSFATGHITIRYCDENPTDTFFRRPLIVAEGLDVGHILNPESLTGMQNIENGFTNDLTIQSDLSNLLIQDNAFDIIYIDWANGTDYIQRNALLLEEVIRYVNARKVPLNGNMEANVVLGISMGGLCARYALRNMENNNEDHETRLMVSYDSPHQGANMPQGYQHLARHAKDFYISTKSTVGLAEMFVPLFANGLSPRQAAQITDQPAVKQLFINWVDPSNNIDPVPHNNWQTDLQNMGYPQGATGGFALRNVAISNGSECATPQPFNAGDNLIHVQADVMNVGILSEIATRFSLPLIGGMLHQPAVVQFGLMPGRNQFKVEILVNSKAHATANLVYKGKIEYVKKLFNIINIYTSLTDKSFYSNAATLPYDNYPGGLIDIGYHHMKLEQPNWVDYFAQYSISVQNQPIFTLVPVTSALDIGSGNVALTHADNLTAYRGAIPPTGVYTTPFDNFITAFNGSSDNEQHTLIEHRNGNWLAAELLETPVTAQNCSAICNSTISGPDYFCTTTSGQYSLPLLPNGSQVTWITDPLGIATPNTPNSIQTTLNENTTGVITLTANISESGCGEVIQIQKSSITVGAAPPGPITFLIIDGITGKIQAQIDPLPGVTVYN